MGKRVIKFKRYYQHDETGRITIQFWGKLDLHDNSVDDFGSFKSPTYMHRWFPFADCQFTGLHDKNGKEIYEGDIVEQKYIDGDSYSRYIKTIFDIISDTQSFWRNCEVIGNIYENHELLQP